jgi:tetratricopeptide (TPR) repeat protein
LPFLLAACGANRDPRPASERSSVLAATVAAVGVGAGAGSGAAAGTGTPAGAGPAAGALAASDLSPDAKRTYRAHLRVGRTHVAAHRYGEAVREFEAALAIIPMDGQALSELGWAAYLAGDYDKARVANTDSVRVASHPVVKAASLYNLGRVAEASGDKDEAARHYRESLLNRPSEAVAARLAALGQEPPAPGSGAMTELPCPTPLPSAEKVCDCLSRRCTLEKEGFPPDVRVARAATATAREFNFYLVHKVASGWLPIGRLGHLYEGGAAGVENSMWVRKMEWRSLGGHRVLRVETVSKGSDAEVGLDELSTHEVVEATVCVLNAAPTCPLQVPIRVFRTREKSGKGAADLDSDGLPERQDLRLRLELSESGSASLVLESGKADETLTRLLGQHQLW